ncbi:LacI family DNA-binding transcriptional regulator [Bifidobacterium sp. ESL0732]|uniref:LacI family DNA-binding transcriptional regulator n=1 Tax=Bifidobacterium sp. ESL0732 TaxID=2983222 RepID=UPI0023F939F9|nr:LacI family DNA-binding transcriptional regulator [Bifidobacterium sp. ESL0732]WEV64136.1 LacI family DNA-binding transcriptional regulator [Bifidobacterium sp. ESL0732]
MKKASISDIARLADVSIGTVSNYLNYPDRVSDVLKARISKVIAELGYQPRKPPRIAALTDRAQTAKKNESVYGDGSSLVGYVLTDVEHSLFTHIFEGIQEVAEDHDMQVIGANAFSDKDRQSELVERFIELKVAGILLSTVTNPIDDIARCQRIHLPVVLLDHSAPADPYAVCAVMENNVTVGRLAAEELIKTGCRSIMFAAHSFDYEAIQLRQLGVEGAIGAGVGVKFSVYDTGGLMVEDGYQFGLHLAEMPEKDRPDGIVVGSDALAVGLVTSLCQSGSICVPDDIGIVGCEGLKLPVISPMPLTVVNAPANEMGGEAMTHLIDEIENPETHIHTTTLVDPKLVRRATTKPNPDANK